MKVTTRANMVKKVTGSKCIIPVEGWRHTSSQLAVEDLLVILTPG